MFSQRWSRLEQQLLEFPTFDTLHQLGFLGIFIRKVQLESGDFLGSHWISIGSPLDLHGRGGSAYDSAARALGGRPMRGTAGRAHGGHVTK